MKVSIILAAYNCGKYLKAAIESALNQDFHEEYEIIIVYRDSQDHTLNVLETFKNNPKIKIINQEGFGLAQATNIGIKNSTGEYIVRLDSDDIFFPNTLFLETLFLDLNPEIDFVYPDYIYLIETSKAQIRKNLPEFDPHEIIYRGDFLSGGTMFRKKIFDANGLFDEDLKILENFEFILRLLRSKVSGYHIKLPLFEYRVRENSMSEDKELAKKTGIKIAGKYGIDYRTGEHHPRNWQQNEN